MSDPAIRDDEVLELRARGETFRAIAKKLGFERIEDAHEAFNRALRKKPPVEQDSLRQGELDHLDAMTESVQGNGKYGADDSARLLAKVEQMRTTLLAD
jgi:hypothetical protein